MRFGPFHRRALFPRSGLRFKASICFRRIRRSAKSWAVTTCTGISLFPNARHAWRYSCLAGVFLAGVESRWSARSPMAARLICSTVGAVGRSGRPPGRCRPRRDFLHVGHVQLRGCCKRLFTIRAIYVPILAIGTSVLSLSIHCHRKLPCAFRRRRTRPRADRCPFPRPARRPAGGGCRAG